MRAGTRVTGPEPAAPDGLARQSAVERMVDEDMRTPLQGIVALAELLDRQPLGGDGAAYVRTIAEHSRRLLGLLSDASDLGRASRGELALTPEPARLRDLLDDVQTEWAPRAAADGVGLGAFYDGDPALSADLDPARLRQVFETLVCEALRYTRRGGVEIGLKAVREGGRVTLFGHVRDTGPRLDAAALAGLFEPAASPRSEGSTRRPELGHRVCRALLDAMGGRIWAENNPGAGVVVRFTLEAPASEAVAAAGAEEPEPALAARILIVDDNATNRMVAQTLVEMFGCSCETANDGTEAVEAVRRGRFDAVLMDIRMPRMDGMEATRAIRALPGDAARLPVIALTANSGAEEAKTYRAAGMLDVVEKPIKADRLLAALQNALSAEDAPRREAAA